MTNPLRIFRPTFARARVPDVPEIQALFCAAQPKVLALAQRRGHTPAPS
jgi:hypothetical protein